MLLAHRIAALAGALALCASAAQAAVTYQFTVDSSSIAGTSGFLEFQFANGGSFGVQQEATATISNFTGGLLSAEDPYTASDLFGQPNVFGQVSGTLAHPVVMSGVTSNFDDYLQGIQFGSGFSFDLTLSGPAIDAPACGLGDCSLPGFSLDLLSADGSQFLLTGDPDSLTPTGWLLGQVEVNRDGSTTPIVNPGPGGGAALLGVTAVPEPTAWALMLLGFGGAGAVLRRRRGGLAFS
jgi:hypothetical protein